MVTNYHEQNFQVIFDSFDVHQMQHQLQQPQHEKIKLLNQPLIRKSEEESNNPVLKQVLHDLRDAQIRYGKDHAKVGDAYNALGLIRVHMEHDAAGARICHEYALTIFQREKRLAKENATTLNDIAYCYERLNLPGVALQHYEDSLRIFDSERISGSQVVSTKRSILRMQRK